MTRDDIIRMAQESGLCGSEYVPDAEDEPVLLELTKFVALVAAAEREECVKVCMAFDKYAAAAIRARGDA